ncbi:TrkA family potassium uptake protein [Roseburia hominis]
MGKQYAVLGMGSFGFSLAIELEKLGCEVIAVDASEDRVQEIAPFVSQAMCAEMKEDGLMKSLGVRNLDGVIVALAENLEISVLATMQAKEMGAPFVLAKAKNDMHANILKKLGADMVVFPEREMGVRIANVLATRNFADWIELSPDYSMVEVQIPEKWIGETLRGLNVRETLGVNVVGMIRGGKVMVNILPDEVFKNGDVLIIIGENETLNKFSEGTV